MSRRAPRFQFFVTMSSRAPYRGGRPQWRRGFSDRPRNGGGRGHSQFVSGDSHFRSVHDSNLGYRQGNFSNHQFRQPPPFNPIQQFRHPPPPFPQNGPVRSRPPDYRSWDQAKVAPPPNSERFVVLSYNLLADYLAINHRSKLYFHIPRHILDWQWRKRSIVFELGLWSADIMCLQEVDRFQDLEEDLKLRGYGGIWKMRTGNAIDGCAIFWRTSRFKLLYEEGIEFNKLGLRDNVAQICVFELLGQSFNENTARSPTSSSHSNKIVVCNIHVLYNPKRGEIKLGQVRTLLGRAYAVSKIWNDAPVVLCGDFNCTPKSPLYNFISEQKLNLSAVDRDKISGQASEIRAPRPYTLNPMAQPFEISIQAPSVVGRGEVGDKPSDPLSDVEKDNKDGNTENISFLDNSFVSQSPDTLLRVSDKACSNMQCRNEDIAVSDMVTKETQQTVLDGFKESSSCLQGGRFPTDQYQINDEIKNLSHLGESHPVDKSYETEKGHKEKANASSHSNNGSPSKHSDSNINTENDSLKCDDSTPYLIGNNHSGRAESNSDAIEVSGYQPEVSTATTSFDFLVADKLENLSIKDLDEAKVEGGSLDEDDNTFLSAFHESEDVFPSEISPGLDYEPVNVENFTYDPSLWTPMEIATATGNADSTFMEHPLQLKSTYAEVEDFAGTRDSNGEPLVTSYNRCFMGTVDYIWRSKGLQTVRVLAPIPKHAMQWTPGFPTKKWGSDHIALASEVAFLKD